MPGDRPLPEAGGKFVTVNSNPATDMTRLPSFRDYGFDVGAEGELGDGTPFTWTKDPSRSKTTTSTWRPTARRCGRPGFVRSVGTVPGSRRMAKRPTDARLGAVRDPRAHYVHQCVK